MREKGCKINPKVSKEKMIETCDSQKGRGAFGMCILWFLSLNVDVFVEEMEFRELIGVAVRQK